MFFGVKGYKDMVRTGVISLILLLLCFTCVDAASIVADHRAVEDFEKIPGYWINQVRKMLLNYPGESHGKSMLIALRLIEQQDSRFAVSIRTEGEPEGESDERLRVHRPRWTEYGWSPWGTGEEDTWTNEEAIDTLNDHFAYARDVLDNPYDVFVFAWCWDATWHNPPGGGVDLVYGVRWAGASEGGPDGDMRWGLDADDTVLTGNSISLQNYLDAWNYYELNNPDMTISYSTGPVDSSGESGYQRHLKYERIREWVINSSNRVLFDYGDILTYNNAGVQYTATWDGHTYPSEHPENGGEYDPFGYGSGHLGEQGCLKIGKAMWWLLARIAGWDGCYVAKGDVTGDCRVNMDDLGTVAVAWLADTNSSSWNWVCDVAPGGGDGVIDLRDLAVVASGWLVDPYGSTVITSLPVTEATGGVAYTYDVQGTGEPEPTFALLTYPAGMMIDPNSGLIEWIPSEDGDYDIIVEAANSKGSDRQEFSIHVTDPTVSAITSSPVSQVQLGEAYRYDVDATGNPAPAYSLTVFPAGMTIDEGTGIIHWSPSYLGQFAVEVQAINVAGTDVQAFTIDALPSPPVITSTPVTLAGLDQLYTYDVEADGAPAPTFKLMSTFPLGMVIDAVTGVIIWTPAAIGDSDITVEAANAGGTDTQSFSVTVQEEMIPQIVNLVLTSTSGNDTTSDDLNCSFALAGDAITAATAWYRNGSPLMTLYMPFEGGAGNALLDFSGANGTATIGGNPEWKPLAGHDGNGAFEFDGKDYLIAGGIFPTSSSYTKSAWVYRTSSSYLNIISGETLAPNNHCFKVNPDDRLNAGHNSGSAFVIDDQPLLADTWYFVAVTYDYGTGEMVLYKNGEIVDSATVSASYRDVTDAGVLVGAMQRSFGWRGMIDDARIYPFALSAEQIASIYSEEGKVIVAEETAVGDVWQAKVLPFSESEVGTIYESTSVTIQSN